MARMYEIDREIRRLAAANRGVVTRRQALALGMTNRRIWTNLQTGRWERIRPGLYRLYPGADRHAELRAACASLPAVVSHQSAAALHKFPLAPPDPQTVTVPHRRTNRFFDVVVHESTDLAPHHVGLTDGIPVTTPARTVVDLAAVCCERRLRRTLEAAAVAGRVDPSQVAMIFREVARRGKPGTQRMRSVLRDLGVEHESLESELELRLVEIIRHAGLPTPDLQNRLPFRSTVRGRVDMAYPEHRLIVEADGKRWHARERDFISDRRRDNLAQLAGWRVLRFTWQDVTEDPASVVRVLRTALRGGPPAAA